MYDILVLLRRNNRQKKGVFMASSVSDLWAIIIFIVICLTFFILFYITKSKIISEINSESAKLHAETYFQNYLQTPIDLGNNNQVTMAEAVMLANFEGDYENTKDAYRILLHKSTENYLRSIDHKSLSTDICGINIIIKSGDMQIDKLGYWMNPDILCDFTVADALSSMKIPSAIGADHDYKIEFQILYDTGQRLKTSH